MDDFSLPIIQVHQKFMAQALLLAEEAGRQGEVPVGSVITYENRIIAKAHNQVEMLNDPTAHAEILAITSACSFLNEKYLKGCTLYVTLEPCPMCAGALVWSKIDRVVFGASDPKAGACGTLFNLSNSDALNHEFEVIQGILEQDAEHLLKHFFRTKR